MVWCEINIRLDSCQVNYLELVQRNDSSSAGNSLRNASTSVLLHCLSITSNMNRDRFESSGIEAMFDGVRDQAWSEIRRSGLWVKARSSS